MGKLLNLESIFILIIAIAGLYYSLKTLKNKKISFLEQEPLTSGLQFRDWYRIKFEGISAIIIGTILLISSLSIVIYIFYKVN